jgi:hypothetical protein
MATAYDSANPYDSPITFDGDPPASTPTSLPRYTMQATSLAGVTGDVPAAVLENVAFEFSAKSGLTFTIAEGTVGYDLVADYSLMKLYRNGVLVDDGQWTVRGVRKSGTDLKKVKEVTAFHRLWDALERTQVMTDPPTAPKRYVYSLKSVGFVMHDLLTDAKNRNVRTVKDLTWTFTGAVDSAGRAWPTVFTIEYRAGTDYSSILANLVDRGFVEVRLRGNEIQLYIADKMGIQNAAELQVGKDVLDAPIQSDSTETRGVMVVTGDDDITVVVKDTTTIAAYGREELAESQGGTSDTGSLSAVGAIMLLGGQKPKEQRTYTVVMRGGAQFLPIRDYNVSDFVNVTEMVEGMTIRRDSYRVRQIVLNFEGGQVYTAAMVVNDKLQESAVKLARKVDGIIGGAVITGSSRTSTPDDLKDKSIPNPPTGLTGSSAAYVDVTGHTRAQATLSWTPPALNTDGTAVTDIDHYRVAWRYSDDAAVYQYRDTTETVMFLSPLDPGRDLLYYVRAIDTSGNWSANPAAFVLTLGVDVTAPPTPSDPVMTSYLGTLGMSWNGLGSASETMPPDFRYVEVATSKVAAFDFDAGTFEGTLSASGDLIVTGYVIGDTVYARFRAVDMSGNKSAPSNAVSAPIHGVSGPDIEANAITTNKISAGAVTAAKILAGAVTTDKLTIGQTANLVQDPGFNDAGWRARRLTTEFTEKPSMWFFKNNSTVMRSGYLLQLLSNGTGVNQGKMMMTDWLNVQMGEKYYVGVNDRTGEGTPNAEARLHLGVEVEKVDGTLVTDYLEITPTAFWFKDGYLLPVQSDWKRIRYWIRPFQLESGDIAVDDFEVRCMIGTTALDGGRIELTAHGLKMWDDLENQTVNVDALFGDVDITGTLRSGKTGHRIEINPGSTLVPEVRFFPTNSDTVFAYINSVDLGGGTIPAIGMNAPDTGLTGVAVVLYDTGFQIGEINKTTAALNGPGIATSGSAMPGFITFYGKMDPNPGTTFAAMYASSYLFAANTVSGSVSKIGTPTSSQFVPHYSVIRITGIVFSHHISANSAAAYTVIWNANTTIATTLNELMLRTA